MSFPTEVPRAFVGRSNELATLLYLWNRAGSKGFQFALVEGEAKIGKTDLVQRFLAEVESFSQVDRPTVIEVNCRVDQRPDGCLRQLAAGAGYVGPKLDRLVGQNADPFVLAHRLGASLASVAPAIVVIENIQAGDERFLNALCQLTQEIASFPVLMIATARPARLPVWLTDLASTRCGRRIHLSGLDEDSLACLASDAGYDGLGPVGTYRLHQATRGNPEHALRVLAEVGIRPIRFGTGPLPPSAELARQTGERLDTCDVRVRELLAAAAVLGWRVRAADLRAIVGSVVEPEDFQEVFDEVLDRGFLQEVAGTATQEFRFETEWHRNAVYFAAIPQSRRRHLHQRAGKLMSDDMLWHCVSAAQAPDDHLAQRLEVEARNRLDRGDLPGAAIHAHNAVELTPAHARRPSRLLAMIETLLVAGDLIGARKFEAELVACPPGAWRDYVAGYLLVVGGSVDAARTTLLDALDALEIPAVDPAQPEDLRARILTQLAFVEILDLADHATTDWAAAAIDAARPGSWVATLAWFARSSNLALSGRWDRALEELDRAEASGASAGLDRLAARGIARMWSGDLGGAERDLSRCTEMARRGQPLFMPHALGFLGEVAYRRGELELAVMHTQAAVGEAAENERFWVYPLLHALASYPLAARDDIDSAASHAHEADTWATFNDSRHGRAYAASAYAALAAAQDRPQMLLAAGEQLDALASPEVAQLFGPVRADALSQLGRATEAADALTTFCDLMGSVEQKTTRAAIRRVEGQIQAAAGDHREALSFYKLAAIEAGQHDLPIERVKLHLAAARSYDACDQAGFSVREVVAAKTLASEIGAAAYLLQAERCAASLDMAQTTGAVLLSLLPPRERQVSELRRDGLTVHEIAQRLDIQAKTVRNYWSSARQLLGVTSSDELLELLQQDTNL